MSVPSGLALEVNICRTLAGAQGESSRRQGRCGLGGARIDPAAARLDDRPPREAQCARAGRGPILDNRHCNGPRPSPYQLARNRNGAHPVNAIFNDAYAVLESEIRNKAISKGYDLTSAIMHEGNDRSSKFIFDLIEPERPKVDRAVLDFVKGHVFDPADFVIRSDGVCRLNPEMARMVVARVSAKRL
jgi:CRISPR associated protein Cas1